MQARELRIGNYVMYEPTIDDWEETIITLHKLLQVDILPDNYCGIPLTEEWLLNLGFIKHGTEFHKQILDKEDYICVFKDMSVCTVSFKNISHCIYPLEFHVHQLQNLYFALTGEELELKL